MPIGTSGGPRIDDSWVATATLPGPVPVMFRLLRESDREMFRVGFEGMSPESRYRRFLSATPRLTEAMLDRLVRTDGWNHVAIAAARVGADGEPEQGLGIARFVRLRDDPGVAEAAVAVVDEMQGQGLGRLLLGHLVRAARERGVERFRACMLPSNAPMQGLFRQIDDQPTVTQEDGLVVYEATLGPDPVQRAGDAGADTASSAGGEASGGWLYDLLRVAARGLDFVFRDLDD